MSKSNASNIPSGVVLIDKPASFSSHDVIARLRGATGVRRIGHAGTLDPLATGLLVVLFGAATRLSDELMGHTKTYQATVTFGVSTTTDDAEGEVLETALLPAKLFDIAFITQTLEELVGVSMQVPPRFSAIKREGKRAYELARQGEDVQLEPRPFEVFSTSLISVDEEHSAWTFEVTVSKGTYIRSLARDLGEKLGTKAHLSALRRTSSADGLLNVDEAYSLDEVIAGLREGKRVSDFFLQPSTLFPRHQRATALDLPILHGKYQYVIGGPQAYQDREPFAFFSDDNRLLGLGRYHARDLNVAIGGDRFLYRVHPDTVFPGGICGRRVGPCVATVGVFDGVHTGHARLISQVVKVARQEGRASVAFTFSPSPKAVFDRSASHPLTTLSERVAYLRALGVDHVIVIPFTKEMGSLSAAEFLDEVLLERAAIKHLVIGADFRMGHGAVEGFVELSALCSKRSIACTSVDLLQAHGERVSSSRIRSLLLQGDVGSARALFGHDVAFTGYVTTGLDMGAGLGFPTANIVPDIAYEIGDGVYAATVSVNGESYEAGLFVGAPREEGAARTFEAHLLAYAGSLYGESVRVTVHEKVNDVQRFHSLGELKKGIADNVRRVTEYFATACS